MFGLQPHLARGPGEEVRECWAPPQAAAPRAPQAASGKARLEELAKATQVLREQQKHGVYSDPKCPVLVRKTERRYKMMLGLDIGLMLGL